uniref:Uncharacterized protein n=1 Tax=viral metagenome TaxID=1070528 RepID=A0A6M3JKL3_9ZZZZ
MTEITESWYNQLIEDLQDLLVETEFTSRWTLIEGYHSLGSRILQENENFERSKIYNQDIVQRIANSLGRKTRTIYYAIQFAREYPNLNLLPEGKNISWHHIINKYLTDGTEKKVIKKADLHRMIKEIRELLETELKKELQSVNNGEIAINKSNVEFIRYLQDQVNKITGGLNE